MIRVILESQTGVIAEAGWAGDEEYLCQSDESRFPQLSQVDNVSYTTFAQSDMATLLVELNSLGSGVDISILEVIALAKRCQKEAATFLSFTPFDE